MMLLLMMVSMTLADMIISIPLALDLLMLQCFPSFVIHSDDNNGGRHDAANIYRRSTCTILCWTRLAALVGVRLAIHLASNLSCLCMCSIPLDL